MLSVGVKQAVCSWDAMKNSVYHHYHNLLA